MRSILEEETFVADREPQQRTVGVELQHINLKLWLKDCSSLDLDPVIPVFHRWIQDQVFEELLLDVADYRHVPAGPGVLLIGHQADYSVDNTDGQWGIRYNRKAVVDGDNLHRIEQAARAALLAAKRLEEDELLERKLLFNGRDIEISINDRLLAPNCEVTRNALDSDFRMFFDRLLAGDEYSLSYSSDPAKDSRRLFGAFARSNRAFSVAELLDNLSSGPLTSNV